MPPIKSTASVQDNYLNQTSQAGSSYEGDLPAVTWANQWESHEKATWLIQERDL